MDTECPRCGTECFIELWDSSDCPNCGLDVWWEEQGSNDYNSYSYIYWDEW